MDVCECPARRLMGFVAARNELCYTECLNYSADRRHSMTRTIRTIWFIILLFVFFFFGGGIIFYSQGWRIDFERARIEKTGAIFVASSPRDAAISINGKMFQNQTGLIQSGTLISSLLPKKYAVRLERAGYYPWQKEITVYPELVTKYEEIVLPPIQDALPVRDSQELPIIQKRTAAITYNSQRDAFIYEKADSKERINISALFNTLKERTLGLPGIVSITHILIHPTDEYLLGIFTENALYFLDVRARTIERLSSLPPSAGAINTKNIVWSESAGKVGMFSFSSREISFLPFLTEERIIKIGSSPSGDMVAILDKTGALYIFDPAAIELKNISLRAKNFEFSADNQKVAVQENDSDFLVYDYEKKKEKRFSVSTEEPILHMAWYKDSEHLFLISASAIYFSEVDDVLPINAYPLIRGITLLTEPLRNNFGLNAFLSANRIDETNSFIYNSEQNTLYFLQKDKLYKFDFEGSR